MGHILHTLSNSPRYETQLIDSVVVTNKIPPSVQNVNIELEPLPEHLKSVDLGDNETVPMVIKRDLDMDMEGYPKKKQKANTLTVLGQ